MLPYIDKVLFVVHRKDVDYQTMKEMEASLIWQRGDDMISSKVYCSLNGVSIKNGTDWLQMANFHAAWSKRFYDVLVPYLNNIINDHYKKSN